MPFEIAFHPDVENDLTRLPRNIRRRVMNAIATRLATEPAKYGKPLAGRLSGYRKLRVGDVRVVFEMTAGRVIVYAALDRRFVYEEAMRRLRA